MATSPSSTYLADNHLFSSPWPPLSSSPSMTAHRFMLRSASAYRFKSFFRLISTTSLVKDSNQSHSHSSVFTLPCRLRPLKFLLRFAANSLCTCVICATD
ncbi:uncharacterized protein LOC129310417 isoform X2 [Prosopis cineraria]|uniref:uncharacterized protein LOC129310417 isoform X2 n=1 Tax=Prosopis cineraria TaxID=364024 RepID=UPI002410574E|nr:uncharacterized protein LOC129310417 isoform X2 [Prosopis cineraria]